MLTHSLGNFKVSMEWFHGSTGPMQGFRSLLAFFVNLFCVHIYINVPKFTDSVSKIVFTSFVLPTGNLWKARTLRYPTWYMWCLQFLENSHVDRLKRTQSRNFALWGRLRMYRLEEFLKGRFKVLVHREYRCFHNSMHRTSQCLCVWVGNRFF